MSSVHAQQQDLLQHWLMQDVARVPETAEVVSSERFHPQNWFQAVVPGTVLTTLVANKVYPEPLYGENMRHIPESLNKTSYWYRTTLKVPTTRGQHHVWIHFGGVNYAAEVWVNGHRCGQMRGAFVRGDFDVTQFVRPGRRAVLAVLVAPQPHPGVPHEHTQALGVGKNGGETAVDGATFLSTIGWDWLAAIRDRDTGLWLPVTIGTTGEIVVAHTQVVSELSDDHSTAALTIRTLLRNLGRQPVEGELRGEITGQGASIPITRNVRIEPGAELPVELSSAQIPTLVLQQPRLWWPNGMGPQNLSHLKLQFLAEGAVSDEETVQFGIRKITYTVGSSDNLAFVVNGEKLMVRGGDWGLDEGMKRIPRTRLDAQMHLHALAGLNMIRNWVGQSTDPDFYDLADQYGLLLWDEFFQPNPNDGPNPTDLPTYLSNVRDKVLRFRNHPSIALWCGRNEGYPPPELNAQLKTMMAELDPQRLYQASSADGRGVSSHGPYYWRAPRYFYAFTESFKTETGSVSIPTLESIQGMMPVSDWETINDDWAQHDMAAGAQRGNEFPQTLALRYGHIRNLADFARKGAAATYEAFRGMYEGRNAHMFETTTGVLTWMSHPAQPSFVWQLYHYDLEANAALFAVKKASEPVHIQLNEQNFGVEVVNNLPVALHGLRAQVEVYNSEGKLSKREELPVTAVEGKTTRKIRQLEVAARITPLYFVRLQVQDGAGKLLSTNFYWQNVAQDDFTGLAALKPATLEIAATSHTEGENTVVEAHVVNPGPGFSLLTHLQMRHGDGRERVLPVFANDNYVSLVPGETRDIVITMATRDLRGQPPVLWLDGYNLGQVRSEGAVRTVLNAPALPANSAATQLVP